MSPADPASAIRLSLQVGLWCAVLGLPAALALGWLLARRSFPGKALLGTAVLSPLVLPPVVTGFLLLELLGRRGLIGRALEVAGIHVPFTFAAAVLAAMVMGMPLYVFAIRTVFEALDPRYEEVSWTLGVPPRRTFLRVTLPLLLPGIGAGATLAFARALGEFGATAVLAGNVEGRTRTIALAVYTLLGAPDGARATRWLVLGSLALSCGSLAAYEALSRWQRRRLELRHGD